MADPVSQLPVVEIATRGDAQRNPGTRVGRVVSGRVDPRTPEQRLADEAARWRKSLREEEARHAGTVAVLRETNRWFLRAYLRERMLDPHDFETIVPLDDVVDESGAIVWERVDLLVNEVLAERPHWGTPSGDGSRPRATSAVQWLLTGT
jgi:hypothetical protein